MQKELVHLLFSFTFFCLFTTNTYAANTNLSSGLSGYKNNSTWFHKGFPAYLALSFYLKFCSWHMSLFLLLVPEKG